MGDVAQLLLAFAYEGGGGVPGWAAVRITEEGMWCIAFQSMRVFGYGWLAESGAESALTWLASLAGRTVFTGRWTIDFPETRWQSQTITISLSSTNSFNFI